MWTMLSFIEICFIVWILFLPWFKHFLHLFLIKLKLIQFLFLSVMSPIGRLSLVWLIFHKLHAMRSTIHIILILYLFIHFFLSVHFSWLLFCYNWNYVAEDFICTLSSSFSGLFMSQIIFNWFLSLFYFLSTI